MTYVYVIQRDRGTVKVGISARPKYRLKQLQSAHHVTLILFGKIKVRDGKLAFYIEKVVHETLKSRHLRGEWYAIPPHEALELVKTIVEGTKTRPVEPKPAVEPKKLDLHRLLTDTATLDEALASRAHPATQVVCECGHRAVLRLSKAEILRKRFRCSRCDRSIDGRRFFIRRVA